MTLFSLPADSLAALLDHGGPRGGGLLLLLGVDLGHDVVDGVGHHVVQEHHHLRHR